MDKTENNIIRLGSRARALLRWYPRLAFLVFVSTEFSRTRSWKRESLYSTIESSMVFTYIFAIRDKPNTIFKVIFTVMYLKRQILRYIITIVRLLNIKVKFINILSGFVVLSIRHGAYLGELRLINVDLHGADLHGGQMPGIN